ncbi:Hypothetical protein mma_0935 [Janthinobacterium sp. Marseille]|nr:Hypothetical protein mma_0935 [Janthinobacterium sp. Marseille]
MLDLALLIFFTVMSYRVFVGINREVTVLNEFRQTSSLAYAALLFPLGPVVLVIGPFFLPFPITYIVAATMYLPALLTARRCTRALQLTGTDRVQRAQASVFQAFGTSLFGLVYVAVMCVLAFAVEAIV